MSSTNLTFHVNAHLQSIHLVLRREPDSAMMVAKRRIEVLAKERDELKQRVRVLEGRIRCFRGALQRAGVSIPEDIDV
jgi:hypothetical protein